MRQYIEGLGLHKTWRAKRNQPRTLRTELVSLLQQRIVQQMSSPTMNWAEKKAYECNPKLRISKLAIPHKQLVKLFTLYEEAKAQGEKRSLEWFAKEIKIGTTTTGSIFSRVGVPPLHGNREFERISEEKASALRKAKKLSYLNTADIAYFSGLSDTAIKQHSPSASRKKTAIKQFRGFNQLAFNKASQIYQAHDLGFSAEETALVCNTLPEIVAYAEHHRKRIEPKIVRAIKTLYPKEKVTAPYINFDNRVSKYK